ncbi:MAG: CHAT domain-containing tetratricopeptide repeat protein [Holophagales bacterium]|nr:CHAT domain-containing tetratricopeptide repeat protein [Holophagales bacterium]
MTCIPAFLVLALPASPSTSQDEAEELKTLADAALAETRFEEALAIYERALAAAEPDSELAARIILNRGWALSGSGRSEEATASFEEAARRARSLDLPAVEGRALLAELDFLDEDLDPVEALVWSRDAVVLSRRAGEPAFEAWAQISLGQALQKLGTPAAAIEPIRAARAAALEVGNPLAAIDADTLLANTLLELQEADEAREVLEDARHLSREHGIEDRLTLIGQLLELSHALDSPDFSPWGEDPDRGLPGEANPADSVPERPELDGVDLDLETLLEDTDSLLRDTEILAYQSQLSSEAWHLEERGELMKARSLQQERFELILQRIDAIESGESFGDSRSWRQLAGSSLRILVSYSVTLGDFETATRDLNRLEDMLKMLGGAWKPRVLVQRATLDLMIGSIQEARKSLDESLPLLRESDPDQLRPLVLFSLGVLDLAAQKAEAALGRFREARRSLDQALELEPGACGGPKIQNLGRIEREMISNADAGLAMALSSAGRHGEALRHALCAVRLAKGVLDVHSRSTPLESLSRAHLLAGLAAEGEERKHLLRRAAELFRATGEHLRYIRRKQPASEQLRLLDIHSIPGEAWQKSLVAQGDTRAALEVAERDRAPELLAGELVDEGLLDHARQLATRHEVTFVVFSIIHDLLPSILPSRFSGKQRHLEESLYIWVIPPEGRIDFRSVDLRELAKVGGLTYAVEDRAEELHSQEPGQERSPLYDHLIAPIADLLPSSTGPRQGGDRAPRLVIVPHGILQRVPFAALRDPGGKRLIERFELLVSPSITSFGALSARPDSGREGMLVVGDPTAGVPGSRPLPEARKEASGIAGALGTTPLLGAAATPPAVRGRLATVGRFHFAGHAEDDRLALRGPGATAAPLTVEEVLGLDLELDLAVLSACRTAEGKAASAGLLGISRAFLVAGARTVVANLWPAEDVVTQAFMERFYHHLERADAVTAHRRSSLELLRRGKPAQEWAGLVVIGGTDRRSSSESPAGPS